MSKENGNEMIEINQKTKGAQPICILNKYHLNNGKEQTNAAKHVTFRHHRCLKSKEVNVLFSKETKVSDCQVDLLC